MRRMNAGDAGAARDQEAAFCVSTKDRKGPWFGSRWIGESEGLSGGDFVQGVDKDGSISIVIV